MLNLIISIVSIALVALMSAAGLYYGGKAWSDGAARGEARQLVSAAEQTASAFQMRLSYKGAVINTSALDVNGDGRLSVQEVFPTLQSEGLLSSIPSVPKDATGEGFLVTQNPDGSGEITASVNSESLCSAVNQSVGFSEEEADSLASTGKLPNEPEAPVYTQPTSYIAGWGAWATSSGYYYPATGGLDLYRQYSSSMYTVSSHLSLTRKGVFYSTSFDKDVYHWKPSYNNYRMRKYDLVAADGVTTVPESGYSSYYVSQIQGFCPHGGTTQYNGIDADVLCVSLPSCTEGTERLPSGQCVAKCDPGLHRDTDGICKVFDAPPDPREGRMVCKSGAFRLRF